MVTEGERGEAPSPSDITRRGPVSSWIPDVDGGLVNLHHAWHVDLSVHSISTVVTVSTLTSRPVKIWREEYHEDDTNGRARAFEDATTFVAELHRKLDALR